MADEQCVLVLSRREVVALATARDYLEAVEGAFRALAAGEVESLPVGHVPGVGGAFHIKAAVAAVGTQRAVIKINGNFPGNPAAFGLPTIQGCVVLVDAHDGRLLALIDTIELTAQRTAAASALAARTLARGDAGTLALVGCGTQARCHLAALLSLGTLPLRKLRCFDRDADAARALAALGEAAGLDASVSSSPAEACRGALLVVTSTPSPAPVLDRDAVAPGAFIAAVGADNPGKCELAPALMARARVVPDIAAQAVVMGDLRSAIAAGAMAAGDIHGELAQLVSGRVVGRTRDDEIFVFDSTGTAIEDLAAATMLYERARGSGVGIWIDLNGG
ncbi:MAG TPA: ornithine cyclodeaminase family protein [Candidatus Saccharimonadia bacterium]|nr:ornithine cyclodeaminase family protein [Candidatus Saccharimonadia bacterium]